MNAAIDEDILLVSFRAFPCSVVSAERHDELVRTGSHSDEHLFMTATTTTTTAAMNPWHETKERVMCEEYALLNQTIRDCECHSVFFLSPASSSSLLSAQIR